MKNHTLVHPDLEYVPWPHELRFRKPSNDPKIRTIDWEEAHVLYEQDVWRERLDALRGLSLSTEAMLIFETHGFDDIAAEMKKSGATYPPSSEDYRRYYEHKGMEYSYEDLYIYMGLDGIPDERLRHALRHYDGLYQHCKRIKALAIFCATFKVDPDSEETSLVFGVWAILDTLRIIEEQEEKLLNLSANYNVGQI